MALKQLTLKSLATIEDGKVAEAFNRLAGRAAQDCYDRPGDKKGRSLSLVCHFTPVMNADGTSRVESHFEVVAKVPAYRTQVVQMEARPNGAFVYNPNSPDCLEQTSILDREDEDEADDD